MLHYASLNVSDLERSGAFYDAILAPLGWRRQEDGAKAIGWGLIKPAFFITRGDSPAPRLRADLLPGEEHPGGQGLVRVGAQERRRVRRRAGQRAQLRQRQLRGAADRPRRLPGRDLRRQRLNSVGGPRNGSEGRHQRLRAHRAQPVPRRASAGSDLDFVAVNDLVDAETIAHLLKYDSILGRYPGEVEVDRRRDQGRRQRAQGADREGPGRAPLGRPRRRGRDRVHRPLHQARGRRQAPRGRRQEGDHLRARDRSRTSPSRSGVNFDEPTTPSSTTSSPTPPAPPTAWRRSPRCCTTRSGSSAG